MRVIIMKQVVAVFKIFPKNVEVDLNKLKKAIQDSLPDKVSIHKFDEEPIAFGVVAVVAFVIMPEEGGMMDQIEEAIKKVKGVSEIDVLMVRRA
ncbi:elongation factor 1-beta [Candidatus Bathyarchaeota archaeon]|nr:elongation factor 1-beta [Candidatus Bathyarchaeota archaeon]